MAIQHSAGSKTNFSTAAVQTEVDAKVAGKAELITGVK
jgi:hypothetical protein